MVVGMSIRSTAKAVIVDHEKVLLNKCFDRYSGEYYSLPGGGQNTYETLTDAVIRECLEETGYTVCPIRFAALCEEICENREFREEHPEYAHKMYHIFVCRLGEEERKIPTETDEKQTGSEWVPIEKLGNVRLLPKVIGDTIGQILDSDFPLFLGSEHIPFNHG